MAKKQWTYFNDPYKFKKVDEFCAWYLNGNADKVRVSNTIPHRPTPEEVLTFIRLNPHLFEKDLERGTYYMEYHPSDNKFVMDKSYIQRLTSEQELDQRYASLKELVHRWAGIIKIDGDNQEALVEKLWPLIAQLTEEKRIDQGKGFSLENYGVAESQYLVKKINEVERRVKSIEEHPSIKGFTR